MELLELSKTLIKFPGTFDNRDELNKCFEFVVDYFKKKNNSNIFLNIKEKDGLKSVLISNVNALELDVLWIGHIDVVPTNNPKMYEPVVDNGILRARGASDMKSQVAQGIKLFEYVLEENLPLKYGMLIVTDEETESVCSDYWANEIGLKAKIIMDGDGSKNDMNVMCYKRKASLCIKVSWKGAPAHGSRPWDGMDANEDLITSWTNLRKVFPYINKNNPPDDKWLVTLHAGMIKGGNAVNSISESAVLHMDFRYIEGYDDEKIFSIIKENFVGDYKIEPMERGFFMSTDVENKYFKLYNDILEKSTGKKTVLEFGTGATDVRFFCGNNSDKYLQAIITSSPIGGGAHTDDEWLNIDSLYKWLDINKEYLSAIRF
ncbi:MAG: M20 family metallopeptidase [Rickettsiales bacterium]|jgi:succinyl-diaminopimelate desuccinylase|nr:M20 family metallopeptidase [Rickettsiales bacterium]